MATVNIQTVEMKHNRSYTEPKYITCEDMNFAWLEEEIILAKQLWESGKTLQESADLLKRPWLELYILYGEMAYKGALPARKNGLLGGMKG